MTKGLQDPKDPAETSVHTQAYDRLTNQNSGTEEIGKDEPTPAARNLCATRPRHPVGFPRRPRSSTEPTPTEQKLFLQNVFLLHTACGAGPHPLYG